MELIMPSKQPDDTVEIIKHSQSVSDDGELSNLIASRNRHQYNSEVEAALARQDQKRIDEIFKKRDKKGA